MNSKKSRTTDSKVCSISEEDKTLLIEYASLSIRPDLTEKEADRLSELLELALHNDSLSFAMNEIDYLIDKFSYFLGEGECNDKGKNIEDLAIILSRLSDITSSDDSSSANHIENIHTTNFYRSLSVWDEFKSLEGLHAKSLHSEMPPYQMILRFEDDSISTCKLDANGPSCYFEDSVYVRRIESDLIDKLVELGSVYDLPLNRFELVKEYARLTIQPTLSESEAELVGIILNIAEYDDTLSLFLNEIDCIVLDDTGFLSYENEEDYENLISRISEFMNPSLQMAEFSSEEDFAITQEEQRIYEHFSIYARFESPGKLIERCRNLFTVGVDYSEEDVKCALLELVRTNDSSRFKDILNRCCHIMINQWLLQPSNHSAVSDLVSIFDISSFNLPRSRVELHLQGLVNNFTRTEQYRSLLRLANIVVRTSKIQSFTISEEFELGERAIHEYLRRRDETCNLQKRIRDLFISKLVLCQSNFDGWKSLEYLKGGYALSRQEFLDRALDKEGASDISHDLTSVKISSDIKFSSSCIKRVEDDVGQLTNLNQLCLSSNQLSQQTPEMGQLASLRQLHLRSNQLSQQPPEMGQLTNLSLIALEAARANEYENWQVSDLIEFAKIDGADFSAFPEPISESVTSQGKKEPIEIFLSYAHKDETLRDSLATHLEKLESPRLITTWHDRNITVGDDWKEEILGQLNWVDIILLLFSDDFFASDCCWGEDDIGQLVNLRPKSASSHNNLGNVYGEQGEYAKAISAYQNALKWNLVYTLVNEGGVGRNLSNANLSNVGLSGADFRGTDLNETNFSKADLNETNLSKVNINSNSPPEEPRPMTGFQDVFISYGRDDSKAFAAKLHQRLMAEGLEVWFDFEDIPLGVDFQSEINGGIEKAHNFLFVISPSSVNSKYCLKEIEHALKHNKRIIPLLYVEEIDQETWRQRNPDGTDEEWEAFKAARKNVALENMHPEVRKINWVYFREGIDDFEKSLAGLLDIFYRHQDYVRQHTYWLNQALTWEQHRKKSRYLLIGEERQQAEDWLKIHFEYEQPPCLPTDLHCEFITESIKHANNRMSQVFLAHAEEDAVLAEKVRHSLIRGGITVWTSGRDIETGEDFQAAINRAIKEADNLVYLLSSASLQSDYCQHEINYALSLNKRIIPLLARPLDPSQIPEALRNLQYINLTDNRVNLSNADINGANLRGANLRGSIISDKTELDSKWHLVYTLVNEGGVGRNLSGANLSRANLSNVDINGINLRKATLCRTDLSDANDRKLLPIRVVPCQLTRMLAPLVYVDLVGKPEAEAAPLFLAPLKERAKPTTRPAFPQSVSVPEWVTSATVVFPGATQTLPFLRTPFFTGREALLEAIHTMLNSRGRVALSGLGGIGKTQIALEYAYRHQAGYERVFWVRAEQPEELVSEYVALAKVLQIPGAQQEDQLAVVTLAKQWLATHDGWLLVLDNADDLRQVRPYLPASSGHILLTTRAQSLGDLAQALPVNQMGKEEGALFLLRRSKVIGEQADFSEALETEQGLARQLTIEMDGLPLALDQAGAYIEDQCLSLEEYLELFQTKKAELLRERGRLDPDHPSVTVTFTLVFEKVAAANELAANLVRACAFLSPDAIPEEIFSDGVKELGDPLSPLAVSKLALTKAIAEAARFSLISRNPRTKTLTIHRLVQEVLRGEMDGETQKNWSETVMQAVTAVFPNAEYENWPQCDRLLPQSQKAAQLISDYGVESKTAALLLSRVGYYFDKLGRYGEAEPLLVEALGMTKRLLGDEHPDVARSLNNLAALYDSQGRYGEAEPLYVEALGMRKRLLGDEHPAVANTLWNLGAMRYQQQQFVEAEALLLEALPIYQKALGENHPNTQSLRSWLKKVQDTLGADA